MVPRTQGPNEGFEFVEIGKKALTSLGPAIKQALFYTLIGIGIGTLLLWWQHYLEEIKYPYVFWSRFLEHLGVGFIVSAIAVFFYEWGAHIKETVELSKELKDTIDLRIEPIVASTAQSALDRSLRELIGKNIEPTPPNIQKIILDCRRLVNDISKLHASGVWSSEEHLDFISYLLESVVENSSALRSLAVTGEGENRFIVAQTAAVMADKILSLQMRAMEKGDSYEVISSLPTWKGKQLDEFHVETQNAISRGVNVKRIFNRLRYVDSEEKLPLDQAERILRSHLQNTVDWSKDGKYEVRVLGRMEVKKSTSDLLREKVNRAHFGIFKHGMQCVRYGVEMADLSDMMIGKKQAIIKNDVQLFDDAWVVARPLTEEIIVEILTELQTQKEVDALATCDEITAGRTRKLTEADARQRAAAQSSSAGAPSTPPAPSAATPAAPAAKPEKPGAASE